MLHAINYIVPYYLTWFFFLFDLEINDLHKTSWILHLKPIGQCTYIYIIIESRRSNLVTVLIKFQNVSHNAHNIYKMCPQMFEYFRESSYGYEHASRGIYNISLCSKVLSRRSQECSLVERGHIRNEKRNLIRIMSVINVRPRRSTVTS